MLKRSVYEANKLSKIIANRFGFGLKLKNQISHASISK